MAEAIVTAVVSQLLDLLSKQASQEIDLLTGVEEKVKDLTKTYKMIQAVLADAERRKIREETVKVWLHEIEDVSYEIDDVLDEWNYRIIKRQIEGIGEQRVCSFIPASSCFCFKRAFLHRDIAVKIKELSRKLDSAEKRKNHFGFISGSGGVSRNPQDQKRIQSTSFVNVSEVSGRVSDKNALISQLLSESHQQGENAGTQVLAIIGAGGIGKTTLAQLAYNDNLVKLHFEQRVWVCVSDPFDEISVAKTIVESLRPGSSNLSALNLLLEETKDSINGKRFLLVLDDVWMEDPMKWEAFINVLQSGAPGSTILLTTRSERVARVAGARNMTRMNVLCDSDSWSLFSQVAFLGRTRTECERLEGIGRQITKKCKGLPLAIKIVGSLLRTKNTTEEWERIVDSNMWELQKVEVDLFPHLYLSYNDLSFPMQRCFSYCAIFPKDEKIIVDDLIHIWMAQGYLNSNGSEDEMELKGMEYFENLAMLSLFQDFVEDEGRIYSCKMHDIVHDFAQYLTKRDSLLIKGVRKVTSCEIVRHLTWFGSEESIDTPPDCNIGRPRSFLSKGLKLETLNAHLLDSLKLVRVLILCGCSLRELPKKIGKLVHLRYLDLTENKLRELPQTIFELFNLQTLNLNRCGGLEEIPLGIEKLTKLRHLSPINRYTKYPTGVGELTCLQTLGIFSVGREYNKLEYLKNLNQLQGTLKIIIWDNLDDVIDAESADLESKTLILELILQFGEVARVKEDAMEALKPPLNLQHLRISNFHESRLPTWMTSLNNLKNLRFNGFHGPISLPTLGVLPSLETITIREFTQMKFVGPAFLGIRGSSSSPTTAFPKLGGLYFYWCEEWEEWEDISAEEESNATIQIMPCLHRLTIRQCPKLRALPDRLLRKASSLKIIVFNDHRTTKSPSTEATTATFA